MPAGTHAATGFDALYGLVLQTVTPERAVATVTVHQALVSPSGAVHGGVYAALAESVAVAGTTAGLAGAQQVATALTNLTNLLGAVDAGTLHAVATRRHRGRTTWVWEVEISDDSGQLCAVSRMTVAVRAA